MFCLSQAAPGVAHLDLVRESIGAVQTFRYPYLGLDHRHGGSFLVDAAVSPILDADGEVQGAVLVFRDVTEQYRLSQEMEFQATHDLLTGLGNRRAFECALADCFERVGETSPQHVVCYLDLD